MNGGQTRGIPRGTGQSNKPLKERKKENGKDHNDVRDCVHIGTRGEQTVPLLTRKANGKCQWLFLGCSRW